MKKLLGILVIGLCCITSLQTRSFWDKTRNITPVGIELDPDTDVDPLKHWKKIN